MEHKKINCQPIFVSQAENGVIDDIRNLELGNICLHIQDGFVVDKKITKNIKNIHFNNDFISE